jgi:hypothetical protein
MGHRQTNSTDATRWEHADASTFFEQTSDKGQGREGESTMKHEEQARMDVRIHDELSPQVFSSRAAGGVSAEEVMQLRTENVRLQRLVAELLVENQQLRQRYGCSKTSGHSVVASGDPRGN